MTLLITADLHLNNLPRDKYRHEFQTQLRKIALNYRAKAVLILGDLTDEKNYHHSALVNKTVEHIHKLTQIAPVIFNEGNHDRSSLTETPFFTFLRRVPRTYWIGEPTFGHDLKGLSGGASAQLDRTLFLPHSPDPERDWGEFTFKGLDWVFAHQTFAGARGDNGRELDGPSADFPEGVRVISGDVHVPQKLGSVTYVGSPYTIDFGDDFEPRVLLIKDGKLLSIPCEGPQKRLIEVKAGELPSHKITDQISPGDILKIRVELGVGHYAKWAEFKDGIYNWGAKHGYVIHLVQPLTKKNTTVAKKATKRQAPKSDPAIVKTFAQHRDLDEPTLKVGLKLVEQI